MTGRELAHQGPEERVVVAGREHRGEERVGDREHHRADHGIRDSVDGEGSGTREETEGESLRDDRHERSEDDRDLRQIGDEDRAQQRSQRCQDEHRDECGWHVANPDPGDDPGGHHERDERDGTRRDRAAGERAKAAAPAQCETKLGPVEVDQDRRITLARWARFAIWGTRPSCSRSMASVSSPTRSS